LSVKATASTSSVPMLALSSWAALSAAILMQ
jgi:hypothetical protein